MATIKHKATLDSMPFTHGIEKMSRNVEGFSGKMKSVGKAMAGAFTAGQMTKAVRSTLDFADEIDNLAKQTDLGFESIQALKKASEEAGVEFETLRPAINQFRRALEQAKTGSDAQIKAFEELGLSMEDVGQMGTEKALEAVARAMANGKGSAETMKAATALLGAESTRLRGILTDLGETGVQGLIDKYKDLGLIMSQDVGMAADKMQESLDRSLERAGMAGKNFIAKSLIGWQYYFSFLQNESKDLFGFETAEGTTKEEREAAAQAKEKELERQRQIRVEAEKAARLQINQFEKTYAFQQMTTSEKLQVLRTDLANAKVAEMMAETAGDQVEKAKERVKIQTEIAKLEDALANERKAFEDFVVQQNFKKLNYAEQLKVIENERKRLAEEYEKTSRDDYTRRLEIAKEIVDLNRQAAEINEEAKEEAAETMKNAFGIGIKAFNAAKGFVNGIMDNILAAPMPDMKAGQTNDISRAELARIYKDTGRIQTEQGRKMTAYLEQIKDQRGAVL